MRSTLNKFEHVLTGGGPGAGLGSCTEEMRTILLITHEIHLVEFFSVRQIWHFCQYCVKYFLLIIVQIEICSNLTKKSQKLKC